MSPSNVLRVFREDGIASGWGHVFQSLLNVARGIKLFALRRRAKWRRRNLAGTELYLQMQKDEYRLAASAWTPEKLDPLVGWWDFHNSFSDYDTKLFRNYNTIGMRALEYGCGPGRNIERFSSQFDRIDGVDISPEIIARGTEYLKSKGIDSTLVANDGKTIPFKDNTFDVVFSVICLQHIASRTVRHEILSEAHRALKPGGLLAFQMGFGYHPHSVDYYADAFGVQGTNGAADVRIEDVRLLESDLLALGFEKFSHVVGEPCMDLHEKWVWIQVTKPS